MRHTVTKCLLKKGILLQIVLSHKISFTSHLISFTFYILKKLNMTGEHDGMGFVEFMIIMKKNFMK